MSVDPTTISVVTSAAAGQPETGSAVEGWLTSKGKSRALPPPVGDKTDGPALTSSTNMNIENDDTAAPQAATADPIRPLSLDDYKGLVWRRH